MQSERASPPGERLPGAPGRSRTFADAQNDPAGGAWLAHRPNCCGRRGGTGRAVQATNSEGSLMLWTIAVILLVLWALGLVTSTTMGGFIHLLLVCAVIVVLVRVIQGRRVV